MRRFSVLALCVLFAPQLWATHFVRATGRFILASTGFRLAVAETTGNQILISVFPPTTEAGARDWAASAPSLVNRFVEITGHFDEGKNTLHASSIKAYPHNPRIPGGGTDVIPLRPAK